ncbi:MAG: molecular chaperone HtpG [Bacilli bacterium]|nr:molecular chaperone HtpG [Bacilli bacterium]
MKKQFKAESKKLLDMMINSIYTNKEIFLRELISNASDALDKLRYKSLTENNLKVDKEKLAIHIDLDKKERTITIKDNGIGMTQEELENNLGTIAKSGSELFKENADDKKNLDIIGQFGVGFYSSFMISKKVSVTSKSAESDEAYTWESTGADGFSIKKSEKQENGTDIILYLKDNTEDENYDEFLENYKIESLIKKYSDYIPYPIIMKEEKTKKDENEKEITEIEEKTINSRIPLWKKNKSDVKDEEYNDFYTDKFYDYEKPARIFRNVVEGKCNFTSLLFIPSHAPYDFYTKEYEKGLQLYSKGVLIMDKCSDLLPDYFSFVKGLVDSEDIALNISRETLQENHQIKTIATGIENKIKKELENMLSENREDYEKFFKNFGTQLKYGIYSSYGMKKDDLAPLLLYTTSTDKKYKTLKEYIEKMSENQDKIYYACGETVDKIDLLPQVELVKDKGYEILYLTDYMDEFVFKVMHEFEGKQFMNVSDEKLNLDTEEEKENLKKVNEENKDLFAKMKETLTDKVQTIQFTHRLKNHPVCLTSKGEVSVEMEKVMNAMPNNENVKAECIMEINENHEISKKLIDLYQQKDFESIQKYTEILYAQARLIEGLSIENPTEITNLICDILSK